MAEVVGTVDSVEGVDHIVSDVICRCTGYSGVREASRHVARRDVPPEDWRRVEDERLAPGRETFVGCDATAAPHLAVFRAERSRGRVLPVRLKPGDDPEDDITLIGAADLDADRNVLHPDLDDEPLLAGAVRYAGQPVAVVLSPSQILAERARRRVTVA